jgi:hypothetical protein
VHRQRAQLQPSLRLLQLDYPLGGMVGTTNMAYDIRRRVPVRLEYGQHGTLSFTARQRASASSPPALRPSAASFLHFFAHIFVEDLAVGAPHTTRPDFSLHVVGSPPLHASRPVRSAGVGVNRDPPPPETFGPAVDQSRVAAARRYETCRPAR